MARSHGFGVAPVKYVTLKSVHVTPVMHHYRIFVTQNRQNESDPSISGHFNENPRESHPPKQASGCSPRIGEGEACENAGGSLRSSLPGMACKSTACHSSSVGVHILVCSEFSLDVQPDQPVSACDIIDGKTIRTKFINNKLRSRTTA
jgi:hypothetical protein